MEKITKKRILELAYFEALEVWSREKEVHKRVNNEISHYLGYPTECEEDYIEFKQVMQYADLLGGEMEPKKRWMIYLHSTPLNPMPGTPLACAPLMYKDFRQVLPKVIGEGDSKNDLYNGKNILVTNSYTIEGLTTSVLNQIVNRGGENEAENIKRLCATSKFWNANSLQKRKALEKYFNIDYLFGEFNSKTLPSRYVRTFAKVEQYWDRPPWKEEYSIKPPKRE